MIHLAAWSGVAVLVAFLPGMAIAGDVSGLWWLIAPVAGALVCLMKAFILRRVAAHTAGVTPSNTRQGIAIAAETVVISVLVPLIALLVSSRPEPAVALKLILSCLPAALVFAAANQPELFADVDPEREIRARRLAATILVPSSLAAVIAAGLIFPASPEARLLGIGPGVVVSLTGIAALFHPDPSAGRALAGLTSRLTFLTLSVFLALVAGFF